MDKKRVKVNAITIRMGKLKELTGKTEVNARKAEILSIGQSNE